MLKEGDRIPTGHRLIKFLGRGNFGEVWQAWAPGNTYAALKFLNLEQSQGRKEYRAVQPLKHLRHANLLQMTAIWLLDENGEIIPDDEMMAGAPMLLDTVRGTLATPPPMMPDQHRPSTLIIAMPFADKSLDQLLKEHKQSGGTGIPRDELLGYMEDAAKAVDFLNTPHHDLGNGPVAIRHCDVKPENLLMMGKSVVLCDFGVSRTILGSSTARKTGMGGSLAYMAPECLSDEVSPYSDQFSLAISYLELRTGKLPFDGESPAAVMDQRRRGVLDLSDLPKCEAAVIRRATNLQPERRFPSCWAMVEALQRSTQPQPRKRGLIAAGLLGISILGSIAGVYYITRPNEHKTEKPGGNDDVVERPSEEPWKLSEQIAFQNIDSSTLTESQFQESVASLKKSIEAGLPSDRLTFPNSEVLSSVSLVRTDEFDGMFFRPFCYSDEAGLGTVQRTSNAITIATFRPSADSTLQAKKNDDAVKFDFIVSFGWVGNQLSVLGERQGKQFVAWCDANTAAKSKTIEFDHQRPIDFCSSPSGQRTIILDWEERKLQPLDRLNDELQEPIKLPDVDSEETFPIRLSHNGDWCAIWTSGGIYVANLDARGSFRKIDIGPQFKPRDSVFSIQVNESFGWITLSSDSNDGKDVTLNLLRFAISNPEDHQFVELSPKLNGATFANLEKVDQQIGLSVGFEFGNAKFMTDITRADAWVDSTLGKIDGQSPEIVTASTYHSNRSNSKWAVYASSGGRLFLQRIGKVKAPTMEIARTLTAAPNSKFGAPKLLHINDRYIIVGTEKGGVEVFSFPRCRLIYEASLNPPKAPKPSQPASTYKS